MDQSGSGNRIWKANSSDVLHRVDGKPCVNRPGFDQYGHGGIQIDGSLMTQPCGQYGSTPSTLCQPSRSVPGLEYIKRPFVDRSGAALIHHPQLSFTQPFLNHTSIHNRPDLYLAQQQPVSQFPQPCAAMLDRVVRKPFTVDVEQVRQRNEIRYSYPSTSGSSQPLSNPSAATRDGSAQAAIEASLQKKRQVQSSLLSTVVKHPRERSVSKQTADIAKTAQSTVNDNALDDVVVTAARGSPLRVPKPNPWEWTTYRIDNIGTRIPKTEPPPQGTYKASEGIGRTDYSDPRDFFAPTIQEQKHVWNALRATRAAFHELTNTQLRPNDMKTLYMGYNAAWNEIRHKLTQWIFENFSPDRSVSDHTMTAAHKLSHELPGYTAEDVQVVVSQPYNPMNIKYFVKGELAVSINDLLPKLERWYGLIADFRFSPTWTYERQRNSRGVLMQNPDCCACMHCRKSQMLCHGFRERADRKCTPCAIAGLLCSNEDDLMENTLIRY